jgi:hypothetical protein
MEKLSGEDLKLACKVYVQRYKTCMKEALVKDVIQSIDVTAPTRKCGHLYADLTDYCGGLLSELNAAGKEMQPKR